MLLWMNVEVVKPTITTPLWYTVVVELFHKPMPHPKVIRNMTCAMDEWFARC